MSIQSEILIIRSDKSELERVTGFLKKLFIDWDIDTCNFNRILLCLSEAIINSIEHGNHNDRNKFVTIRVKYEQDQMHIDVSDEGEGFDLMELQDPTEGDNLKKESGRGIHIIRSLSDDCSFSQKGNKIHLKICCR